MADDQDYVHLRLLRGKRKEVRWFDTLFGRMAVSALKEYFADEEANAEILFSSTDRTVRDFIPRISLGANLGWRVAPTTSENISTPT